MDALIIGSTTVLADTTKLEWLALNDILQRYGRPQRWSFDAFRQMKATGTMQQVLRNYYSELVLDRVIPELTDAFFDRISELGILSNPISHKLLKDAQSKGVKLAIASDECRATLDRVRKAATPYHASDVALSVAADEMLHGKPHPAGYLRLCSILNVQPSMCASIETTQTGIDTALAAGMTPYILPGYEALDLSGAEPWGKLCKSVATSAPKAMMSIAAE